MIVLLVFMIIARRDPNGRVFGWLSSCVSFLPLLVTTLVIIIVTCIITQHNVHII